MPPHKEKLKILVSAYACSPYQGSEPGLGWNIVKNLSKKHELHVITEEEKFKDEIERELNLKPQLRDNLKFYYIRKKRGRKLRKLWPPSYYWFYKDWQKRVFQLSNELIKNHSFDVIHQFNMIGYREPGYLLKIKEIPLVWGPVGGFAQMKASFLSDLPPRDMIFYTVRNIYNYFQMLTGFRVKRMTRRADIIMSAAVDSKTRLKKYFNAESILVNETGSKVNHSFQVNDKIKDSEAVQLIWVGKMEGRKALQITLKALAKLPEKINFKFNIVGDGVNYKRWSDLAVKLNITQKCLFYGRLSHEETQKLISNAHIMLFPSLQEGTPHVVLESLSHGVPVICHDANGQGSVIDETCGIKVPLISPKESIAGFRSSIEKLANNEELRLKLAKGARVRAEALSWENKAEEIIKAYHLAIKNFHE